MTDENETPTDGSPDPVRKITKYVLIIVAILFLWYVVADRIAPWTDQARVQAYVIPIVPQVSGRVVEVNVVKDQVVEPGHVLLKINPSDYELASTSLAWAVVTVAVPAPISCPASSSPASAACTASS